MSHQTGIKANSELIKFFGKLSDGKTRIVKIVIENDELKLANHKKVIHNWERDYEDYVTSLIDDDIPCYMLFRLDIKNETEYKWLLLSWVPDTASIRNKMVYASTKASLKTDFGSAKIKEEIHGTTKDEMTLKGYYRHKSNVNAPAPLTTREEEIQELRKSEIKTDYGTDSRQQSFAGIACKIEDAAINAIHDMSKGRHNYLQFRIELKEERIYLEKATTIDLLKLPNQIPAEQGRYHLYIFKHTHDGDYIESVLFVYSLPGYSCSVKERMMYSSCKAPFVEAITSLGLEIQKKLEIGSGSELTEEFLYEELHPKKALNKPLFAKPKGPPNRGVKRLTKVQNEY